MKFGLSGKVFRHLLSGVQTRLGFSRSFTKISLAMRSQFVGSRAYACLAAFSLGDSTGASLACGLGLRLVLAFLSLFCNFSGGVAGRLTFLSLIRLDFPNTSLPWLANGYSSCVRPNPISPSLVLKSAIFYDFRGFLILRSPWPTLTPTRPCPRPTPTLPFDSSPTLIRSLALSLPRSGLISLPR